MKIFVNKIKNKIRNLFKQNKNHITE